MSVSSRPDSILVVDDDPLIRDMMVDMLEAICLKNTVCTARNGHEALDKLSSGKRYLVFLDVMMPGMTGEELCQRLNAEPQLRSLHTIVIMSAADQARTLGADATMRKPFEFEDVMEMVERYM